MSELGQLLIKHVTALGKPYLRDARGGQYFDTTTGLPSCILGHALHSAGLSHMVDGCNEAIIRSTPAGAQLDEHELSWLAIVQTFNDLHMSWKECVHHANNACSADGNG